MYNIIHGVRKMCEKKTKYNLNQNYVNPNSNYIDNLYILNRQMDIFKMLTNLKRSYN